MIYRESNDKFQLQVLYIILKTMKNIKYVCILIDSIYPRNSENFFLNLKILFIYYKINLLYNNNYETLFFFKNERCL